MIYFTDDFPGRTVRTKEGEFLYFGGTSYLGLQQHPEFQEILINNIKKYGTNYGASRKSNVRLSIYEKVEKHLAQFVGSEACCTVSSGYMASQLVCHYFSNKKYTLYYAPHTHTSLLQADSRVYQSYDVLEDDLKDNLLDTTPVILLDSIDFLGINYPDFLALQTMDLTNVILVVDDSHGFGVLGTKGEGVFPSLQQLNAKEVIVCGSLGKGFGLQAGAILGSKKRIDELNNTPFFGGASPATPANMATLIDAQHIFRTQLKKLKENLHFFNDQLKNEGLFVHPGTHPTYTFLNERLVDFLVQKKILVTSFRYPDKDSAVMSRIVISAHHTKNDLEYLTESIDSF
ncbi:aminotransferase class I/II-fold pyridoxal phosphate-dependent enzyme [Galbibacter sp. EGI 63066]|uniref:aminotransferase class I/II-fold pyridoxal phosphate-dependent enzyme n=1 Tax=Galbibacter sp. EGI 63066 TaxID=2993559 RepID=UPI0022494CA7|nr:aminotransferase class I/II-fold pyridoxal phosphate-dependent enzyme [Galbibacter sp. EGI 63066]MCX2681693.1 aminotransferase class I/II-fold pyridoxal phosphate-dependent enzyme [Galbibacter sp. EGI 63066]